MPLDIGGLFKKGGAKLVEVLGDALDKNITNKEERDAAKLALTQEVNRNIEALQTNILKEQELENADRDSARKREEAFVKATGRADYFQYFIGTVAVVATCFMVFYVLKYEIPEKNEHVVMLAIGELLGIVSTIFAYHFGSSMGSRIKDMKKG